MNIKTGDRVSITIRHKELRGVVTHGFNHFRHIVIKLDNGGWIGISKGTPEWDTIEKIATYKAHSIEYLRSLPKKDRPCLK